ncbi:MAG: hypothetical protein AAF355_15365 [Myxococcota bacterium]
MKRYRLNRLKSLYLEESGEASLMHLFATLAVAGVLLLAFQAIQLEFAQLLLGHAARRAARSASVVVADDSPRYAGAMLRDVRPSSGGPHLRSVHPLDAFLDGLGERPSIAVAAGTVVNRLETIRAAAIAPLIALAPPLVRQTPETRDIFFEPTNALPENIGFLSSRAAFVHTALAANVVDARATVHEPNYLERVDAGSLFQVRLTYAHHCSVPLARLLLCSKFQKYPSAVVDPALRTRILDLRRGGGALEPLIRSGARFRMMVAQAGARDLGFR